jgi:hypothetical protein
LVNIGEFLSSASKTGLLESNVEAQKSLKEELEKIGKQYGSSASGEFPTFKFNGNFG